MLDRLPPSFAFASTFRQSQWRRKVGILAIALLSGTTHTVDAMAQSQSYKTGYGRVQSPPPAATREAPSSGLSLGTGTLLVTGALAAAVGIGLAVAGTGGDDNDGASADSGGNVTGTSTK